MVEVHKVFFIILVLYVDYVFINSDSKDDLLDEWNKVLDIKDIVTTGLVYYYTTRSCVQVYVYALVFLRKTSVAPN